MGAAEGSRKDSFPEETDRLPDMFESPGGDSHAWGRVWGRVGAEPTGERANQPPPATRPQDA